MKSKRDGCRRDSQPPDPQSRLPATSRCDVPGTQLGAKQPFGRRSQKRWTVTAPVDRVTVSLTFAPSPVEFWLSSGQAAYVAALSKTGSLRENEQVYVSPSNVGVRLITLE